MTTEYKDGWYWLEIPKDKTLTIVQICNAYTYRRKVVPHLLAGWWKCPVTSIAETWKLHGPIQPPVTEWNHGQSKET